MKRLVRWIIRTIPQLRRAAARRSEAPILHGCSWGFDWQVYRDSPGHRIEVIDAQQGREWTASALPGEEGSASSAGIGARRRRTRWNPVTSTPPSA